MTGALPLVLASTSPFRRELLQRLGMPFLTVAPDYAEEPADGLPARDLALRNAQGKAREVAGRHPRHVVIGSDQVAEVGGKVLGKPGSEPAAVAQLSLMAGRTVSFHTGLAVIRGTREEATVETYRVRLRPLSQAQIVAYVARERPLECAGSFRIEGLGIALMEEMEGRDYTALIGLPLIALTEILTRFGRDVLARAAQR